MKEELEKLLEEIDKKINVSYSVNSGSCDDMEDSVPDNNKN